MPVDLEDEIDFCTMSATQFMRAQIARINSSTRVAPLGLFRMRKKLAPGEVEEEDDDDDEEEEDDEDDEEPKEARLNAHFKQPTLQSLLDQNNWVHTTLNILQEQARTKWWNPNPDADDDDASVAYTIFVVAIILNFRMRMMKRRESADLALKKDPSLCPRSARTKHTLSLWPDFPPAGH